MSAKIHPYTARAIECELAELDSDRMLVPYKDVIAIIRRHTEADPCDDDTDSGSYPDGYMGPQTDAGGL